MNNQLAIITRRQKVYNMKMKGYTITEIAEKLKVHRNTISKDLKYMTEEAKGAVSEELSQERLGNVIREMEEVAYKAWKDYERYESPQPRTNCLNLILKVKLAIIDVLQSTGAMPKAADKLDLSAEVKRIDDMTESELKAELAETEKLMEEAGIPVKRYEFN